MYQTSRLDGVVKGCRLGDITVAPAERLILSKLWELLTEHSWFFPTTRYLTFDKVQLVSDFGFIISPIQSEDR